jgi:hypothetical protein
MKMKVKDVRDMVDCAIVFLEGKSRNSEEQKALNGLIQFAYSIFDFEDELMMDMTKVLALLAIDVADPENYNYPENFEVTSS